MAGKKTTQNIPENENKKAKFKRVCKPRVQKAIKAIRLIGFCANPNNYEFGKPEITAITKALTNEIAALQLKFETPNKQAEIKFEF